MATMNEYGLTYEQWLAAAKRKASPDAKRCWKDGEDPSDHRAYQENEEYRASHDRSITAKDILGPKKRKR